MCTPLGGIALPMDERVRGLVPIRSATTGAPTVHQMQSLNGLLEHFVDVLSLSRAVMFGLYRPWRPGGEAAKGPSSKVQITALMRLISEATAVD